MKIFITGATGFIGSHLCHRLIAEGHEMTALVRNLKKTKSLPQKNIRIIQGDLSLFENTSLALPPCDVFIHLAGIVTAPRVQDYDQTNHQAVKNIVRYLENQGWKIKKFIFASSLAASGPTTHNQPLKETDPNHPIDPYGKSKLLAEECLQQAAFPVTIFRPGAVFGEGDPATFTLFKTAVKGFGFKVMGSHLLFSHIYVHDLVDAIVKMVSDNRSENKTYFVNYKKPVSDQDLWKALSLSMNKKVRVVPIPKTILFILMLGGTLLSKIFPFKNQLDIKQYRQMTASNFFCSSEWIQKDLDWEPKYDLQSSIQKSYEGYKRMGWL